MVAIVGGTQLGLELGTAAVLGSAGVRGNSVQGRTGERIFVNASTGNLVVQSRDEFLASRGDDSLALRTYNSQGVLQGVSNLAWTSAPGSLEVQGTVGGSGSRILKYGRDGAAAVYTLKAGSNVYESTDGAGAYDTLQWIAADGQFQWTDGTTGNTERFEGTLLRRMISSSDTAGNTLTYGYDADTGLVETILNKDGDKVTYVYAGGKLASLRTEAAGVTQTRVEYTYYAPGHSAAGLLQSVRVDLTPESSTDSSVYVTSYTYVTGTSLIKNISQTDGTALTFEYEPRGDGRDRVKSVTDALGHVTTFTRVQAPGGEVTSTVQDALGKVTKYEYDSKGQLIAITAPAIGGVSAVQRFDYNERGDVKSVADGEGNTTVFEYDPATGNLTLERDAAGNTIQRTYDMRNQLLTQTRFTVADADGAGPGQASGAQTARYVYDSTGKNLLRYEVSAQGWVTEHQYNGWGERIATVTYGAAAYGNGSGYTEAALTTWTGTQDKTRNQRAEMEYLGGLVSKKTSYTKLTASGVGVLGTESVQTYVYDQSGRLLKVTTPSFGSSSYTYDGLGRVETQIDSTGNTTLTDYDDAGRAVVVTLSANEALASRLTTTSAFDAAGRLISTLVTGAGLNLGTTIYEYDAVDRLRMTKDAGGVSNWFLYDAAGRKVADIDGNGTLTEYSYDKADRLTRTFQWGRSVADMSQLVNADLHVNLNTTLANIRPATSLSDRGTWKQYDAAGRVVRVAEHTGVESQASVTETLYNGLSQVTEVVKYATTVNDDLLAAGTVPLPSAATGDQSTRYFYDSDGHLRGTLDAEGYFTSIGYNAAGQVNERRVYATKTLAGLRANGSFTSLQPAISGGDQYEIMLYDAKGQLAGAVDAEKYFSEYTYDGLGNPASTVRYAKKVTAALSVNAKLADLRPVLDEQDQITTRTYDGNSRLLTETSPDGVVTQYVYDGRGNLVSTTRAAGTTERRTQLARYDLQGRLTAELAAQGASLLEAAELTGQQIAAIWRDYGVTHTYDARGLRTSTRDPLGNTSWFYYDEDGALRFTINALGEVRENRYDARGRLSRQIVYGTTTDIRGPGGLAAPDLQLTTSARDIDVRYAYTRDGAVSVVTDAAGHATTYTYDTFGRKKSESVDPEGLNLTTRFGYDDVGNLVSITDPLGSVTRYGYDELGLRTSMCVDEGVGRLNLKTTYTYDGNGNVVLVENPEGELTYYAYDAAGRRVFVMDHLGDLEQTFYDDGGRPVKTIKYGAPVDRSGLAASSVAQDFQNKVDELQAKRAATPGSYPDPDWVEHSVYDAAGLLRATVAGTGAVKKYTYDRNGNLLSTIAFADRISMASWVEGTMPITPGSAFRDHRLDTVYDAANRAIFTVDGIGAVVEQSYDAAGRVLKRVGYATAVDTATARTAQALAAAVQSAPQDAITRYRYDEVGRVTHRMDGTGAVTGYVYDVNGNVVREVAYARTISVTGNLANVSASGSDRITSRAFDAANRMVFQVDGANAVVEQIFDKVGRVTRQIAYATTLDSSLTAMSIPTAAAIEEKLIKKGLQDRTAVFGYDGAGRQSVKINPAGALVETSYDGAGRTKSTTAYALTVSISGVAPTASAGTLLALKTPDVTRDRVTSYAYSSSGRLVTSRDSAGALTSFTYDGVGRVKTKTLAGATETYTYNAASQVIQTKDTLNESESRTFDGLGRQITFTNKKGVTWTFVYDAAGRLASETSPLIQATTTSIDTVTGKVVEGATVEVPVLSTFGYDALGNLTRRTEAFGRPERRDTVYSYDAAGRQIGIQFPTLNVYEVSSESGIPAANRNAETSTTLKSATYYNAFGEARANRDVGGALSQKVYDASGRVLYEVDALGYVTAYERNAFGEVEAMTRHASKTGFANRAVSQAGDAVTATQVENALALMDQVADRTLQNDYDKAGRVVEVRQGAGYFYDYGTQQGTTTVLRDLKEYNAFGEVIAAKSLDDFAATQWRTTTSYYDLGGRISAVVDAMGYLTTRKYDQAGNLSEVVEYSAALPLGSWTTTAYNVPTAIGNDDRKTTYTYDDLNRKLTETRWNVEFSTSSNGTSVRGNLTTSYAYDAVGNQIRVTDAAGGVTSTLYDALGWIKAVKTPAAEGTVTGRRGLTEFRRDVYGKAVVQIQYASGGVVSESNFDPVALNADTDRRTLTRYDRHGHALDVTDANGNTSQTSYDAYGRAAKTWQKFTDADPVYGTNPPARTTFQINVYDALGQLVETRTPASTTVLASGLQYAFAEATYRQEVQSTNAGDTWTTVLDQPNKVTLQWSNLIDIDKGMVRVKVDYMTQSTTTQFAGYTTVTPSKLKSVTQEFTAAAAAGGAQITWPDATASVATVYVTQWDGDRWVTKWSGAPSAAVGSGVVTLSQANAGLVYVVQEYNAFGELVRKGLPGEGTPGDPDDEISWEYFDYDKLGRVWRTNSGDGGDRVLVHDLQGNVTSELRSTATADITRFASAAAASGSQNVRRVDMLYDDLGRLVERMDVQRSETVDGVSVVRQFATADVLSTVYYFEGVPYWPPNSVRFEWNSSSALGSGDLRVKAFYRTASGAATSYQEDIVGLSKAANGVTLTWSENAPTGPNGQNTDGIVEVTRMQVWKKTLDGQWALIINQTPGFGGNEVEVGAPADTQSVVKLMIAPTGTEDWFSAGLASFGNAYRFDASGLAVGSYQYKVLVTPPGGLQRTTAQGTLQLTAASLGRAPVAPSYSPSAVGFLAWAPQPESTGQVLRYRLAGTTNDWSSLTVSTRTSFSEWSSSPFEQGVDTSVLLSGTYQYELLWSSSTTHELTHHLVGTFTVNKATSKYSATINTTQGAKAISSPDGSLEEISTIDGIAEGLRPLVHQKVDRWGNVLEITDPRWTRSLSSTAAWKTTYRYNASNQLIEQTQAAVNATDSPTTKIYYDKLGREVAVKDARGYVNGKVYDAAGNLIKQINADGTATAPSEVVHLYDSLGNKIRTTDAEGRIVAFVYDDLGNMVSMTKGTEIVWGVSLTNFTAVSQGNQTLTETWKYDELGRRIQSVNAAGETTKFVYDARGNLVKTIKPLGMITAFAYDTQGRKIAELDANSFETHWTYDYFGVLVDHSDLGGERYTYKYNYANELIKQTNSRGQDLDYTYDGAGQLTRIIDRTTSKWTTYSYDLSGRRIREKVIQGNNVYQDNHLAYDELGRLRDVADSRVHMTLDYDKAGNRTRVWTSVDFDGLNADVRKTQDRYFAYDAMNRQTVVDAVDSALNLGEVGHRLAYDRNGNRISDTHWGMRIKADVPSITGYTPLGVAEYNTATVYTRLADGLMTESYTYDSLNRLKTTVRNNAQVDLRLYDAADRVIRSGSTNLPTAWVNEMREGLAENESDGFEVRVNKYDANGRILHQRTSSSAGLLLSQVSWDPNVKDTLTSWDERYKPNGYDAVGNVKSYAVHDARSGTFTEYTTQLARYERHEALTVSGASQQSAGTTTMGYDKNGFLVSTTDSTRPGMNKTIVNDSAGKALFVNQSGAIQRQLIANGEALGVFGVGADPDKPWMEGEVNWTDRADFGFGYAPISRSYPNAAPGSYIVQSGDTLQSIAQVAYGDSALWFRIAAVNGLAGSDDIKVGQSLTIPSNVGGVHNNISTFEPYDPSKIVGDATPNMPGPKSGECGIAGQIAMVVVAIVVCYFTAGAAAGWLSTTFPTVFGATAGTVGAVTVAGATTTLGGAVIAGAVGGAAGSIASQLVGRGIGATQSFDWKAVALSAIAGGVSQGLNGIESQVIKAAVGNAISQGIGVSTGLQDHFDWRGVVASAVGAGVGDALNSQLKLTADGMGFGEQMGKRLVVGLLAGAATAAARGGKVAIQQVASDAFGNALGESLASASSIDSTRNPSSVDYENEMDRQSDAAYNARQQADLSRTSGDFARMDGAGYRSAPSEPAFTDTGLQFGRGGLGARLSPEAVKDWSDEINGGVALRAMRDADIDAEVAAERARLQALARQRAAQLASAPAGSAANMDARDIRGTFGYQSMLSRQLAEAGGAMAPRGYPEMRAPVLSARETAVDWMLSVVGTSRAGNVVTGAFDAWLAAPEALAKLPGALGAIPSAATRLANATASYGGRLLDDPLGTAASTMADGVDGFRSGWNRTVNGDGRAMGAAVFALGTMPLGPRYQPGVVTFGDDLLHASGRWLDAGTPTPIPLQVAKQLEGQSFRMFPDLQSAVWRTIGNDAELSAGFGQQAIGQMSVGNAPFAPRVFQNAQFGGRFNLHHVDPVGLGGAVYDLSNIRIVSPTLHTSIHYPWSVK